MKVYFAKYACLLVLFIAFFSCSDESDPTDNQLLNVVFPADASVADQILILVNQHRQSIGLSTLIANDTAAELAAEHNIYMIQQNAISHDNFKTRSSALQDQLNARRVGENVARFQRSAQDVVTAWLNSPGHRENIEGNYSKSGIAATKDSNGKFYYTHLFYND